MTRMMRLLTLSLALGLYLIGASAASLRAPGGALASTLRSLPARAAVSDGPPQTARSDNSQRTSRRSKRRSQQTRAVKADVIEDRLPPRELPAVTELDLEGLKKLLARGDDPAKAKPLLVNFWATWCDPCREEFPDLVKIDADYRGRGLEFASVSGDDVAEIKTSVPRFLQQMHAGMTPYLLNVPDMGEAIGFVDPAWGGELPATYLYDRTGRVVFKHFGRVDPKELRAALDKVLAN